MSIFKHGAEPKSWREADEFLGVRGSIIVANNTVMMRATMNQSSASHRLFWPILVMLHGHVVVEYCFDGAVYINHCGWTTRTTRDRIERFAPVEILGSREWRVRLPDGRTLPFEGNMRAVPPDILRRHAAPIEVDMMLSGDVEEDHA